jgi:hypothetical protein
MYTLYCVFVVYRNEFPNLFPSLYVYYSAVHKHFNTLSSSINLRTDLYSFSLSFTLYNFNYAHTLLMCTPRASSSTVLSSG